jgi:hypothetical protein
MKKTTVNKELNTRSEDSTPDQHKLDRNILLNARKTQLAKDQKNSDTKPFKWLTEDVESMYPAAKKLLLLSVSHLKGLVSEFFWSLANCVFLAFNKIFLSNLC